MPEEAPFDRIISAASGQDLPIAWKEQLKIGGWIVAPVKDAIHLFVRKACPPKKREKINLKRVFTPASLSCR